MSEIVEPTGQDLSNQAVRERVFVESRQFRAMLSTLIPEYGGKWVVFRDGQVQSVHDTEDEAFVAGLQRFGADGAFIIPQVREVEPVLMSGIAGLF